MKRIEFIGAQGCGKSTLLHALLQSRAPDDVWMKPAEAEIRIARGLRCGVLRPAWRKALWLLLQLRIPPHRQHAWACRILQQYDDEVFDGMPRWARYLMDVQIRLLAGQATGPDVPEDARGRISMSDGLVKAKAIAYSLESLMRLARLASFDTDVQIVEEDGGLLQNHFGAAEAAQLGATTGDDNRFTLLPNGVVFCDLHPDELFRRRKARIAAGQGQFTERTLSDDALRAASQNMALRVEQTVRTLHKIGIPTLIVSMTDAPSENAPAVLTFIREIMA